MTIRLQNKVAVSRYALPVASLYAIAVWTLCGLLPQQWWVQFACFALSAYLMVVLNNNNALLRVYSRMVSCSFIALTCMACFMFESMRGAITQLCLIAFYVFSFQCYQDKESPGTTYYAFLCIGLGSTVFVQILFFVPFLWLLAATQLNALSWRTLAASLLGLLTPYWFAAGWMVLQNDFHMLTKHFTELATILPVADYSGVTLQQTAVFAFTAVLALTGMIHFWRNSSYDKIRTRQLYGYFSSMTLLTALFLVLQPQHYDILMRLMIVNTAPLAAHFITLTHTKITNLAFIVITVVCLVLTAYNTWMSSSIF